MGSVATLRPRQEFSPSGEDIAEIVHRIDGAASVLVMCGGGCHGAADLLRGLSDRIKAPLIHSVKGKDIMPYDDPRWMGGIGMIGTKAVYNAVMHCDLLLMVGTDYPYSEFLPRKGTVIQIDERPQVLGRRAPTVLGVAGSTRPRKVTLASSLRARTNSRSRVSSAAVNSRGRHDAGKRRHRSRSIAAHPLLACQGRRSGSWQGESSRLLRCRRENRGGD